MDAPLSAVERHRKQILPYGALAVFVFFIYHAVSDKDFSFLLVRGSGRHVDSPAVRRPAPRAARGRWAAGSVRCGFVSRSSAVPGARRVRACAARRPFPCGGGDARVLRRVRRPAAPPPCRRTTALYRDCVAGSRAAARSCPRVRVRVRQTMGAMLKLFGFALVGYTVVTTGSAEGVSSKTLQAYIVVFTARLLSVLNNPGYLPYDSSGDWFYQVVLICIVVVLSGTVAMIHTKLQPTYEKQMDSLATGGNLDLPHWATVPLLAAPALLLAMIIHPSLNSNWLLDTSWTFALYLEAVAAGPQLWMFHKRSESGSDLAPFTTHMVFSLGVAALLHLLFWLSSHDELNTNALFSNGTVGYLTVLACIVQVALMGDFLFLYIKAWQSGQQLVLPSGRAMAV